MEERFDIAVVGAGPCGLSVGVAAHGTGLRCVTFDKGCITRAISLYPTYGTFFSTPEKLELGELPFIIAGARPTRREALIYYRRVVSHFGVDVRQYEEVLRVEGDEGDFLLRTRTAAGEERGYRAARVVVATGYFDTPNLLAVPGEELPKVSHWYREGLPYFGERCLVVGGGNSAAEAALDLHRSGAHIGIVHFLEGMDPGVKPWIMPDLKALLESGAIRAHFGRRVAEIRPASVLLDAEDGGGREEVGNDFVFAMTGWTPEPLLLRPMGVGIDAHTRIPFHDPDTMETDRPGIYIAGVLATGSNKTFIENGRHHGGRIVRAVLGGGGRKATREDAGASSAPL